MKSRGLSGNCGIGVFCLAFICIFVSFCAPAWLQSDTRITGAKLDRLGLWSHCFRSLPDPLDDTWRRFFVGCRWVYDPFTTGYDQIRGFLLPGFMIATQFFYTLCFIGILLSFILVLLYFLCCGPEQERYVQLIKLIALINLVAAFCGLIAVIVFGALGNSGGWMPDHANNWLGWAYGLAVAGVALLFIAAILFLVELATQSRRRAEVKESQIRFSLEQETKA